MQMSELNRIWLHQWGCRDAGHSGQKWDVSAKTEQVATLWLMHCLSKPDNRTKQRTHGLSSPVLSH